MKMSEKQYQLTWIQVEYETSRTDLMTLLFDFFAFCLCHLVQVELKALLLWREILGANSHLYISIVSETWVN
jgi:hypothetical protein